MDSDANRHGDSWRRATVCTWELDASRVTVAGDSVGGNMATALSLLAKERGDVAFVQQVLFYPVTDAAAGTAGRHGSSQPRKGHSMSVGGPQRQAVGWQRAENALMAAAIVLAVVVWGQPWWILLVAFLAFDLSAAGYVISQRAGVLCYNAVHSYTAPGVLIAGWSALQLSGVSAGWMVMLAACWGFHVAVDRALGFGLKLGPFDRTHLNSIAKPTPASDGSRTEEERTAAARTLREED